MSSPFTYLAWDLLNWTQLDPLPYVGVTFGEQMNQPGAFNGELVLTDPRVQLLDWQDATRPGRTALFIDYLGTLVWGGIIWSRGYDEFANPKVLKIRGNTFGSYFQQRLQAGDYTTTFTAGTDPMTIAQRLVNDAIAESGGNIAGGITITLNPSGGSGQVVSPSYPGTQLQTIDSIVSTLAEMGYTYGFDYSFDVAYQSGTKTPAVTMNIWYPRQGNIESVSQIVILHKDVIGFTYDEDATQQALAITETGSGSGGIQPVYIELPQLISQGYPLLEEVISRPQVNDAGTLSNIAQSDIAVVAYPVTTPTLTVALPQPDPVNFPNQPGNLNPGQLTFDGFNLGDDLLHVILPAPKDSSGNPSFGINNSPRFVNGYSFEWRISGWTCTVADKGISSIMFDLVVPPSSSLPPIQAPIA